MEKGTYDRVMLRRFRDELAKEGHCSFYVRARPGAPASKIREVLDDASVKIDIAAPAESGKANAALITLLAMEFGIAKSAVRIVSGETARMKLVRITR